MQAIVAVNKDWGIGRDGRLLFSLPEDMRRFKELTLHKVVVMGWTTFLSLPGGKPLKDRTNIVLTHHALPIPGATVCHSVSEVFRAIAPHESDDVFVIGGEAVYKQFLDYCASAFVTKVQCGIPADRFFPSLDEAVSWRLVDRTPEKAYNGSAYSFCVYENNALRAWEPYELR